MKIAIVSPVEREGGAAVAATRLCDGLARLGGHAMRRFVASPSGGSASSAIDFMTPGRARQWMESAMYALGLPTGGRYRAWATGRMWKKLIVHLGYFQPDVINVHGFNQWSPLTPEAASVAALADAAPLVWTLHDLWPATGCCDYPTECRTGQSETPYESCAVYRERHAAHRRALAENQNLAFATPTTWLAREARRHLGDSIRVDVIPYGVDLDLFRPVPRRAAREALELPLDAAIVLFVAEKLTARRKGAELLVSALRSATSPCTLVTVGTGAEAMQWPPGTRHLGSVRDALLLRAVFNAADVTAVPSLIDNLPNVLLESFACGTPCVGFRTGGLPDAIRPGVSGALAEPGDMPGLGRAIDQLLAAPRDARENLRVNCRALAEREYGLERQAKAYEALFASCVEARGATKRGGPV